MAKKSTYSISVKVELDTEIQVAAESFEEALSQAREYKLKDVVSFDTPYNDGDLTVTGVYKL